jgi:hypothetical protein
VDHHAADTVIAFGDWLEKARAHVTWDGLAAACTNASERQCIDKLPRLLETSADDALLEFVRKVHVRTARQPDVWRQDLRGLLYKAGMPNHTLDRILDILIVQVQGAAPYRGQLVFTELIRACKAHGIEGPTRRAQIYVVMEGEIRGYTEEKRDMLINVLATILRVEARDIRLLRAQAEDKG